jgi:hypothetical protein
MGQRLMTDTRLSLAGKDKNLKNDEWYTNEDTVKLMFDLLDIKHGSTIMMPFDTEASNFVKYAHQLDATLQYQVSDWLEQNYDYDYLITNPPFSIKDDVIERCLASGKPSVIVLPIDSLGGVRRHSLYKRYSYPTVYIPTKRINYISQDGQATRSNYFHSIILYFNDPKGARMLWE